MDRAEQGSREVAWIVDEDVLELAVALRRREEAFALATVVRCERPTSAKPGARALIRANGAISGWVGGACAEPVIVREAIHAMREGRPRLVGLVGESGHGRAPVEGMVILPMTCHSGGTLEIYVEPFLPRPALVLIGHGPVVDALADLGRATQFAVTVLEAPGAGAELARLPLPPASAVVVAGHGDGDEDALAAVLDRAEVGYVSLVASRRRAGAVVDGLRRRGLSADRLARLKAPAGLDLGAITPEEIAVSILAEIIQYRRPTRSGSEAPGSETSDPGAPGLEAPGAGTSTATDPVCGMTVDVRTAHHRAEVAERLVYFCCLRCKEIFDRNPALYPAPSRI